MIPKTTLDNKKCNVSVIIITQNEGKNIEPCLKSLIKYFDDIWVIDSYSEDNTIKIAEAFEVNILSHQFTHWAAQRNWALANAKLKYEWILFLDADEQVTEEFCRELQQQTHMAGQEVAAMNVHFQYYFLGKPLHFAYESPPVIRLIRRERAFFEGEGAREYARVTGELATIKSKIIHWDRKGLAAWTAKHIRNAAREVEKVEVAYPNGLEGSEGSPIMLERPVRQMIRAKVWNRLPRLVRPFAYFIYRYFIRGGILDGKAGFAYCFLHALWYPLLIDLMMMENLPER